MDPVQDNVIGDAVAQDTPLPKIPDMKDFKMPTQEELLEILSKLDLPEADKDEIRENLLSGNLLRQLDPSKAQQYGEGGKIIVFLVCLLVMVLVFAFFGYKLYRSQTEKERKREEKKKQKQQKKKQK